MPGVSVIINCFNGAKYLRQALDSIFDQTFKDWEIIFWDNGSDDGSGNIATSYGEKVRYFRSDVTTGLGCARNLAFEQAKGNYIAILDADDIWLPHKLERQLPLFDHDAQIGMTFSDCIFFGEDGDRYNSFQISKPKDGYIFGHLLTRNFIPSGTMIFRRTALETVGTPFDESYTMIMDYDLSLRMAHDYRVDFVDDPLSKWRMHDESQSNEKAYLFPIESAEMIRSLICRYPNMVVEYREDLKRFHKSQDYSFALDNWRRGDRKAARNYLSQHLNDKKFTLILLATWFMTYTRFQILKEAYYRSKLGRKW